jgi:hypothetical protein
MASLSYRKLLRRFECYAQTNSLFRQRPWDVRFLAQSGHHSRSDLCPLSGVKRTSRGRAPMSAFDPKRTFVDGLQVSVTREGEEDWGHYKKRGPNDGGLTAVNVVFVILIRRPVLFPECFEPLRKLPAGLFHGRNHNDLLCGIRSQQINPTAGPGSGKW